MLLKGERVGRFSKTLTLRPAIPAGCDEDVPHYSVGFDSSNLKWAVRHRRFLTMKLSLHLLAELLHCRVGSKRVAFWHFSYCPPPNRACGFHRTRLSSVSFHLSFFLDDVKYIFDFFALRMSLYLSV